MPADQVTWVMSGAGFGLVEDAAQRRGDERQTATYEVGGEEDQGGDRTHSRGRDHQLRPRRPTGCAQAHPAGEQRTAHPHRGDDEAQRSRWCLRAGFRRGGGRSGRGHPPHGAHRPQRRAAAGPRRPCPAASRHSPSSPIPRRPRCGGTSSSPVTMMTGSSAAPSVRTSRCGWAFIATSGTTVSRPAARRAMGAKPDTGFHVARGREFHRHANAVSERSYRAVEGPL